MLIVSGFRVLAQRGRTHPQIAPFRIGATVRPISALERHRTAAELAHTAPRSHWWSAGKGICALLHRPQRVSWRGFAMVRPVASDSPAPLAVGLDAHHDPAKVLAHPILWFRRFHSVDRAGSSRSRLFRFAQTRAHADRMMVL